MRLTNEAPAPAVDQRKEEGLAALLANETALVFLSWWVC